MRRRPRAGRRGLLLPIVLLIVSILAVLAATFGFHTRAELTAMSAVANQYQARLVAEAGLQRIMLMLRTDRDKVNTWYSNEEELQRVVVWLPDADPTEYGPLMEVEEGAPAWYYSVVADDPLDDELDSIRYGITDEGAKLNLNTAPREHLLALFQQLIPTDVDAEELVESLLDWRDEDEQALPKGAESDYYQIQEPPTRAKNRALESVEELLLIRGFTADVVYGEDMNRNGILDDNEDDGEASLPIDNADGTLNRGVYAYATVVSREPDTSLDNRRRISLRLPNAAAELAEELAEQLSPATITYLTGLIGKTEELDAIGSTAGLYNPGLSPVTVEELPIVMDRVTLLPPLQLAQGRINVNTAPAIVLKSIGLPDEVVQTIVTTRLELEDEPKQTPAWLISAAEVPRDIFAAAGPYITARAYQFTVECVGFAEHNGAFSRLEAIVELRGKASSVQYLRDLTSLGIGYPVRLEYGEGSFARTARR
jgi:type II secretory pathway component PulK